MIFVSPFLILSLSTLASSQGTAPVKYTISSGDSCLSFPVDTGRMYWDEDTRTCKFQASFARTEIDRIDIAKEVTLEILPGGNMTIFGYLGNNGTVIVNGGNFQNIDGYIHNMGTIIHEKGTFANRGSIVSGLGDDPAGGYLILQVDVGSNIVNEATLQNSGYIISRGRFANHGDMQNDGKMEFIGGIVLNNGTIVNDRRIEIASEFTNNGTMENSGMLIIYRRIIAPPPMSEYHFPVFNNYGDLTNTVGTIRNSGEIQNFGTISNEVGDFANLFEDGKGVIENWGTIENKLGSFSNQGVIENKTGALFVGETGGSEVIGR